jgi:lipopolysaccharide export system protein LptA
MIFRRASVGLLLAWVAPLSAGDAPPVAAPTAPPVPTVIESGAADMVSSEKETTFSFSKGVTVTATNMTMTCDDLVVVARRGGDPLATLGKQQGFKSLIATGNVRIVQNDREATAGRAEVFPDEDKVVLSGDPVVRSAKDGWEQTGPGMRLVLYRGQRRASLEGPEGTRTRLLLPPLKDLGYDKEKEKPKLETPAASAAAAEAAPTPVITVPIPVAPK